MEARLQAMARKKLGRRIGGRCLRSSAVAISRYFDFTFFMYTAKASLP